MADLTNWQWRAAPGLQPTVGVYVSVAPATFPDDAQALFAAIGGQGNDDLWDYIPIGPFVDAGALGAALAMMREHQGWDTYLLREPKTNAVLGMANYMRIRPEAGSTEIGAIVFSKKLQRTPAATEAMYLMARHLFEDLGYRRYEWKCNNDNAASRRAAVRFGFTFEGVFRQDMVVKGRNRDTAWYSIIDSEWPAVGAAMKAWLAPENFDEDGRQRATLASLREAG